MAAASAGINYPYKWNAEREVVGYFFFELVRREHCDDEMWRVHNDAAFRFGPSYDRDVGHSEARRPKLGLVRQCPPTFLSTTLPSTNSRSASGKLVRRYPSTDMSVGVAVDSILPLERFRRACAARMNMTFENASDTGSSRSGPTN